MRRVPPPLHKLGRTFSEMSPLNPRLNPRPIEEPRGISYGSLSPYFGFLRTSMFRATSMQVN